MDGNKLAFVLVTLNVQRRERKKTNYLSSDKYLVTFPQHQNVCHYHCGC